MRVLLSMMKIFHSFVIICILFLSLCLLSTRICHATVVQPATKSPGDQPPSSVNVNTADEINLSIKKTTAFPSNGTVVTMNSPTQLPPTTTNTLNADPSVTNVRGALQNATSPILGITDERPARTATLSPCMTPVNHRVFTTNSLPGFQRDFPSLYPPAFFANDVRNRNNTVLDIGAHNGGRYTLAAARANHTVLSFEASPFIMESFKATILRHNIPLSLVSIPQTQEPQKQRREQKVNTGIKDKVPSRLGLRDTTASNDDFRVVIPRDSNMHPRVYLIPFALSHFNGEAPFYETECKNPDKATCGKANRLLTPRTERDMKKTHTLTVPTFRLDDIKLPVPEESIWFVKIDVGGHELEVLHGGRNVFSRPNVQFIAIEFSANGKRGTKWGVDLLEELYALGFSCFHLRGFGKCHDNDLKSPSLKCNYPFEMEDLTKAPTFQQYAKVFEITDQNETQHKMADLMCKRRYGHQT